MAETLLASVEVDGYASHELVDEDDAQVGTEVDLAVESLAPRRSTGEPTKNCVRAAGFHRLNTPP